MKSKTFTTSYTRIIPSHTMQRVCTRVRNGDDWQAIQNDELRDVIPIFEDDIEEANEVLHEAQERNDSEDYESAFSHELQMQD